MVVYDLRLRKPKIGCSSKMRVSSKMGGGVLRRWKVLRRWVVSDLCAPKIEEHPSLIFDARTPEVAAPIFVPRNRRSWSPPIFVLRPRRSKNPSYLHSPEPAIEEFPPILDLRSEDWVEDRHRPRGAIFGLIFKDENRAANPNFRKTSQTCLA